MFYLRPANERGHTQISWLDSYHTFSFGGYYDSRFMGFGDLRVINDDVVAPGQGFEMHPHNDMEIISIVLNGELEHRDSLGSGSVVKTGEIQKMTAGSGILHSEFNPSATEPVHFLQIWIIPNLQGLQPSYEQRKITAKKIKNKWGLRVSPGAEDDSVQIHQDAYLYQTNIEAEKKINFELSSRRMYWLQTAGGSIEVQNLTLVVGDGLAISGESGILEVRGIDNISNILLFDLRAQA